MAPLFLDLREVFRIHQDQIERYGGEPEVFKGPPFQARRTAVGRSLGPAASVIEGPPAVDGRHVRGDAAAHGSTISWVAPSTLL